MIWDSNTDEISAEVTQAQHFAVPIWFSKNNNERDINTLSFLLNKENKMENIN